MDMNNVLLKNWNNHWFPEASLYRYFESKHKLLLFIMSLYWFALDKAYKDVLIHTKSPEEALKMLLIYCQHLIIL